MIVCGLVSGEDAAAAKLPATSSFSEAIARLVHPENKDRRVLRGSDDKDKSKSPIDMIKEAMTDLTQDDDVTGEEDNSDLGVDIDAFFTKFGLNEDEKDDTDESVVDLPKHVDDAIERHVQQEIAKEMIAYEDADMNGSDKAGSKCPSPKVPAQNMTCLEIIESAFEKDFVKITRRKEKKIFKLQQQFEEAIEAVKVVLSDSVDEDVISAKCDWDGATEKGDMTSYRSCVKHQIRLAQKDATLLRKKARQHKKKKTEKQISFFEKKQKKLLSLRTTLLPRCDNCVDPKKE